MNALPIIDVLRTCLHPRRRHPAAEAIRDACRRAGFFYVVGHGVDADLQHASSRSAGSFSRSRSRKSSAIRMELGGLAWRGDFPVRGELTRGSRTSRRACISAPSCPTIIRASPPGRRCTAATSFPTFRGSGRRF